MATEFPAPGVLSLDGDVSHNWKKWHQMFDLWLEAKEATTKADKVKIAMLLSHMGQEGVDRYNQFPWAGTEDKNKFADVIKKFEDELGGDDRILANRFKFWEYPRGENQPFDDFLTQVKAKAELCQFQEKDNMVRDKIVFSSKNDPPLLEKLIKPKNLPLTEVVEMCRATEIARKEMKIMRAKQSGPSEKSIDAVKKKFSAKKQYVKLPPKGSKDSRTYTKDSHSDTQMTCSRCGRTHGRNKCPAIGQTCDKCGGPDHFAVKCRTGSRKRNPRMHYLQQDGDYEEEFEYEEASPDEYFIGSVHVIKYIGSQTSGSGKSWFEVLSVGNSKIKMKIDTGAETNAIPMNTWKKIPNAPKLKPSKVKLRTLEDEEVEHVGATTVTFQIGRTATHAEVFVTRQKTVPILGLEASIALGIVAPGVNATYPVRTSQVASVQKTATQKDTCNHAEKSPITMESLEKEYKDVFSGLGKYPGKYRIQLSEGAQPVVQPARRLSQKLLGPFKTKLDELENRGVIAPVDYPTDWVNNPVLSEKKNLDIRVCLDPKELNKYIKREHFPLPTFQEVITQLGGKKVFTILDQKDAYWQVELEEESTNLCTFNTPFGRKKFLRMPFGITSASEVQQKKTYEAFGDIAGVHVVADDMLIAAENEEEHDQILRQVLDRARTIGVKFNLRKTQLKKSQVMYMGTSVGADGIRPDESKIKAIVNMPEPEDKDGVRRLIGMLNFLSSFIPNKSQIIAPLRSLLRQDVPWSWDENHRKALQDVRNILTSKPVLKLYNARLPVTIQADASSTGLGACLLQEGQPVAYISRALTDTESRYAQIEKELLAIVYAAEKFHHYIYGTAVHVQSDHKPLEYIMNKPIHKATPRIQLMLLRLMRYKLNVCYKKGSQMYIADTLSRAYLDEKPSRSMLETEDLRVHSVTEHFPASSERLADLRRATENDKDLTKLRKYIQNGWPKTRSATPPELHPFWNIRDEIHEEEGLLFIGHKLVVPDSKRGELLQTLHEGHLGVNKCQARARDILYWPNMNKDIELTVSQCATCATHRVSNHKEPCISHDIPDRPWSKLGTDIFHFGGHSYLVVVDYYSKFPEVVQLKRQDADAVVTVLKQIFARHGIPDLLISDNMPFDSHRFKEFAREWRFGTQTSSPEYPQSNGQSERFVGIVKHLFRKACEEEREPHLALLQFRNTPISGLKYSPAQLLMNRRLNDKLPCSPVLLNSVTPKNVHQQLKGRQAGQRLYYNKSTKPRAQHSVGDSVRVKLHKTWDRGVITGTHHSPRSYYVTTENGRTYRRNSRVINRSPDAVNIVQDTEVQTCGGHSGPTPGAPPVQEPSISGVSGDVPPLDVTRTPTQTRTPVQTTRVSQRQRSKPVWHEDYEVKQK